MIRKAFAAHRKLIVALVGAGVTVATLALGADDPWVQVVTTLATAVGVYEVPNAKPA